MCVIDDVQWLDRESAQALSFVARRLEAEPVAMVFAVREPCDVQELGGLPELVVEGLDDEDARALLASGIPGGLDEQVRDRIVAETRGNPLALLELPRGLTATELAGGFGVLAAHALPGRIEQSYLRRLDTLPDDTRMLLLIAAAEPIGDPLLIWRAAEPLGVGCRGGRLRGGRRAADDQRASHVPPSAGALGDLPGGVGPGPPGGAPGACRGDRPGGRPGPAGVASRGGGEGPDEEVASELERSAGRAQARGGLAAAAAFLQRAVALTGDIGRRVNRALAAAHASVQAGAFDVALGLLAMAEAGPLDELQRARVDLLRAEAAFAQSRGSDAPPLLLRAAKTLEPLDPRARAGDLSGRVERGAVRRAGSRTAAACATSPGQRGPRPRPARDPRASDLLLDGFALLFTDGRAAAAPVLQRAATGFAGTDASPRKCSAGAGSPRRRPSTVWDFDTCVAIAAREVELARDSGALAVLAVGAQRLRSGRRAGRGVREGVARDRRGRRGRRGDGHGVLPYGALVLAGLQGREAEASVLIDATIREATSAGQGTAVQYARWASAILLNGLGRYNEAVVAARDASDDAPELFVSAWALSELIEAATRSGQMDTASSALRRLAEHARASPPTGGSGSWRARARC